MTTEHTPSIAENPEPYDAQELATEADEVAARDAASEAVAAETPETAATAGAPASTAPTDDPGANLLERALRAAGSDAAKYLPVRFIPALTSLLTTRLFTDRIDPADYGAFYLLSAITSLLAALAVNWISSSAVRYYWPSRKGGKLDSYLATVVWTGLASLLMFALAAGAAAALGVGDLDEVVLRLVPAGIVYFIAHFYTTLLLQVLRAANRANAYARLSIWITVLVTVFSVAFVLMGYGSLGILAGVAIGNVVVAPFVFKEILAEGSVDPRAIDHDLFREFLTYGMPLVPVGLSSWALVLMDRFVLTAFRSAAEVGVYSVAYGLGDKIMQLVTMPLLLTMMPSLTEAFERRGQALAEKMQTHFTRYFSLLTFPMLAGMAAVAPVFMAVFTGPQYRGAFAVLPIVAAGSMLGSFAQVAGTGLGMHKKTTVIMQNTLVAAAVNVVANVVLVPRYGYIAAAWDTVLSYAVLLGLTWWRSREYMRWQLPWEALGRVAAASAGMGALVWGASRILPVNMLSLVAEVILGVVAYVVLVMVLGGVRAEERAFAGELGRRAFAKLTRRS